MIPRRMRQLTIRRSERFSMSELLISRGGNYIRERRECYSERECRYIGEPMINTRMLLVTLCALVLVVRVALAEEKGATSVPTFHCLSIYWSPEKGAAEKKVLVKFRDVAEKTWHDGLP